MTSTTYEQLTDVANRLSRISRENAYDVHEIFTWPATLPDDRYWIAPELMTCYATSIWEELTEEERVHLSHLEAVHFFSLNVNFIRDLIGEVANRIYTTRYPGLTEFFHDFISEENDHMWFFGTFCLRYGGKLYPSRHFGEAQQGSGALRDLMVFGRILITEELCDAFNAPMGHDDRLPPIVSQLNLVHHQDESRHIGFGRQMLRSLVEQATPEEVAQAGSYLSRYVSVSLRMFYNPAVYDESGIARLKGARARLVADPARQEIHRELMHKSMAFMERIGLFETADVAW